ncbi:MAG: 3-carboxy-cis,cis-muconate cycloisomerase [Chloroflexota bacterium]|nr:MAG: 3-carboxy-cis,cis-muconate cycloisomerase [Chloroflexota bacterium]
MTLSQTNSELYSSLFGDPEIAALFSEEAFVRFMLRVEVALAKVQGGMGVIPVEAAERIARGAADLSVDLEQLRSGIEKSGVPVIDLVRQLRLQVGPEAADYVHWGATTQDIMDTALVLQVSAALDLITDALNDVIQGLARLADRHRYTLMAGRTHSQQALPITFVFKVAGWLAPLLRHRQRLKELAPRLLAIQFGGGSGTLAALDDRGLDVQDALARQLDLGVPLMPWHTQRDNLAELAGWLSMVSSSLAKMAQDVILLAQTEVGEVRETADPSRGGSSTMPQKSNPIISELIIAAARTNASLLSAIHQSGVQEHERGTHGWQMEWLSLPQMVSLTAATLKKALFLSQNLAVDPAQMRANLADSNGLLLGEAITYALSPKYMRRAEATVLVKNACRMAIEQDRHLLDVVQEVSSAPVDWKSMIDESDYLGSTDVFVNRVLFEASD